jgi:MatE protein
MVGTNIGAGQRDRAVRAAWIGAALAAGLTEVLGLAAAAVPHAWLALCDTDPAMLDAGTRYLHAVGPLYGLFGLGMALYFASQGAGRLLWPLLANLTRLAIAAGGWRCAGAAICRRSSSPWARHSRRSDSSMLQRSRAGPGSARLAGHGPAQRVDTGDKAL